MGDGYGNIRAGDTCTANKQHQYAALAEEEENKGNNNEITGVDNCGKITGLDSNNESAESGNPGSTDEAGKLALIEEAIAEAERDIAEANDLLAGTETEIEEARNENMIHPALQVPTVEHTYNLRQRKHPCTDYTNR